MAAREYVRTLTVRSREEGAVEVAKRLHSIADAQRSVQTATQQSATVIDFSARKLASLERAWATLETRLEGSSGAMRQFERDSRTLQQAFDAGKISVEVYSARVQQLRQELQSAGSQRLGFAVDQSGINSLLGVNQQAAKSARDAAAVFEAEARSMEQMAAQAARLRAELDPMGAAYERMAAQVRGYQDLADRQLISQAELALATQRSRQAFDDVAVSLQPVGERVKLTAGQVQNLGYQANDVATMLAMGASPFAIIASQAGQVVQALGDGPQGVRGSLAAIGTSILGLATPVNLLVAGLAAVAAGAIYFGMRGREKVVPLTDTMKAHQDAVGAVASAYGAAATEAANFQRAASGVAAFNVRQSRAQLELSARASLRENFQPGLMSDVFGSSVYQQGLGENGRVITEVARQYAAFEAPVLRLVEGLEKGTARADLFVDEIAKIANLDPANEELQKAAKRLVDMAGAAADAQRQLQGLGTAFSRFATQTKQFNDLAGGLGEFIPNRLTSAEQIEQTYQQMMRLAKTEADITRAQDLRRLSLEGLAEVETRRRAGYDLDVRAITARSAADRAQIEYERTYADVLASTNDKEQAALQAREARDLSLRQSSFAATEAMNDRIRAGQQQVGQLQLEIDTFGRSAGEIARLRAETDMLTAAREAARQAGGIVDPTEEQAIRDQAAAIGELTDRMTRLNLERDQAEAMQELRDEASVMHLNADARRVVLAGLEAERELRREGIDVNGAWGASYVQNARDMVSFENALDKQQEAFEGLREAVGGFFEALGSGEGVLDALAGAFSRFGQQLAQKGFDTLFDSLFGNGGQGAAGIAQIGGAVVRAANQNVPVYGANRQEDRTFAAPVAAVERRVLPALTNFSTELTAAAKAIRTIESGSAEGNYAARGPVVTSGMYKGERALGAYQIMPGNLPQWSQAALGRVVSNVEFLSSPKLQDAIFEHRFGGYASRYGWEGASRAWFAGEGGMKNYSAKDVVGTSVGGYGGRFGQLYAQFSNGSPQSAAREYERATERGVERGVTKALPASPANVPIPTARPGQDAPARSGLNDLLGVAGAGLGAFAGGYNSQSTIGALVSGGFSGFGAAPTIAAAFPGLAGVAGPLGIAGGIAASLIGKVFGDRARRRQEHEQKAQAWEQMRPAYEAFDRSLNPEGTGALRESITSMWSQLSQFMATGGAAWRLGTGNSSAQFQSTGTKMFAKWAKEIQEFQDGYLDMLDSMNRGGGLNSAFAQGRQATKDLKKQIDGFMDDVAIAFGSSDIGIPTSLEYDENARRTEEMRNEQLGKARSAAVEYSLSLLHTADTMSEVEKVIDGLRGTAAGVSGILQDLGISAEEAGRRVDDRLNRALANVAQGLNESIRDRIEGLAGVGYFSDVRAFLEEFATLEKDVAAAGADPSGLPDLFRRQLQAIVDGSELTGTAFTDLIAQFPALAGVVREFTESAIAASATEIRDAIKGYEERLFQAQNAGNEIALFDRRAAQERLDAARFGADGLAALEAALAAERLNIGEQMQTAYRSFLDSRLSEATSARAEAESALRAEYERTVSFVSGLKGFLDSIAINRDTSTLDNAGRLAEAAKQYRDTLALAQGGDQEAQDRLVSASEAYLREARDYYATSEGYGAVYDEINATLKTTMAKAESELEVARRQASFLSEIAEGTRGLGGLLKDYLAATQKQLDMQKQVDGNRYFGINPERNRLIDAGFRQSGLTYTGNYGIQADGSNPLDVWFKSLSPAQQAIANGVIHQYIGINRAEGGAVWGPGTSTSDSIRANLSNGEYVVRESTARSVGYGAMDVFNRTGRLPEIAAPRMPAFVNDNRAIVAAIERMERTSVQNAKALGELQTALAQEDRRERRDQSAEAERRRESSNRLAARRSQAAA